MNREEEFEFRLADWLEDGPFAAPDHVVAAAIEHARTHPRRRPLRIAFWRRAMNETHAAPVAPRHPLQVGRRLTAGLAVVAVIAIVVASGAWLVLNRGSTPAPIPAATSARTPGPTATIHVTGTSAVKEVQTTGTETLTPDGNTRQVRGIKYTADSTGSDPRIVGTSVVLENEDTDVNYSLAVNWAFGMIPTKIWGTMTLTGPNGSWTGSYAGFVEGGMTGSAGNYLAAVLLGTGAYRGLEYRFTSTSLDSKRYQASGVIEPVPSLPPRLGANAQVIGTDTCQKMRLGPESTQTTDNFGSRTLGANASCTVNTGDQRVNGPSARTFNEDRYTGGVFTQRGTSEIVNAGGTWTGVYVLSCPSGNFTGISFAYIGSGGYAGLRFHGGASYSNIDTYIIDGAIAPAS